MASIPFAARALVGMVPALALEMPKPVTLQEMIEDFCRQLDKAHETIVNVMQSGSASIIIHCKTERDAEVVLNSGLSFRGYPLALKPAPNTTWVKLTRVVYGTTENAVKSRLSEYGSVLKIRREQVNGIGISVFSVKIELKCPIPSRITIAHYPVNVFYRGQVQQCFRCEQTGHLSKNCPRKKTGTPQAPDIVGPTEMEIPPPSSLPSSSVVESPVVDAPATSTSYSEESMETTVNADTGKRQHHQAPTEESPAKIQRLPDPSYVVYERERVRLSMLNDTATDEDHDQFEVLLDKLPDETLDDYQRTFVYRHPLLTAPGEEDFGSLVRQALEKGEPPDGILDVCDTELFRPELPPESAPSTVSYGDLESVIKAELLRAKGMVIAPLPKDLKASVIRSKQTQPQITIAFMNHFYLVYPELLDKTNLSTQKQSEYLSKILARDT